MTSLVLILAVASLIGFVLVKQARQRAARRAAEELQARARAARRNRVPEVSANLKGVTASQTLAATQVARGEALKPGQAA